MPHKEMEALKKAVKAAQVLAKKPVLDLTQPEPEAQPNATRSTSRGGSDSGR